MRLTAVATEAMCARISKSGSEAGEMSTRADMVMQGLDCGLLVRKVGLGIGYFSGFEGIDCYHP